MKEEKILKRDDRLLRNEKSWRRARIAVICLAIVQMIILIFIIEGPSFFQREDNEGLIALMIWTIFWLLLIDWLNLRLSHIDSIKLYRNKINP
jgi:hypothetical protein